MIYNNNIQFNTPFINSDKYLHKETHIVHKDIFYLDYNEILYLKSPTIVKKFLEAGQQLTWVNNDLQNIHNIHNVGNRFISNVYYLDQEVDNELDNEDDSEILFDYSFFPFLLFEEFLQINSKKYYMRNFIKQINVINKEMISTLCSDSLEYNLDMENYVYLCWIQLWALSFHYQHETEKHYWFQELLKVLKKVKYHDVSLNYIFIFFLNVSYI